MAIITNLKKLTARGALRENDEVVFLVGDETELVRYEVRSRFLYNLSSMNSRIFDFLNLDKGKFCSEAYGYESGGGGWPESKDEDYAALTRVVEALYRIIEKKPIMLLHESLSAEELAIALVERCGISKAQEVREQLEVQLTKRIGASLKDDENAQHAREQWQEVSPDGSY
jgi:hypothetical protein